ncbi:MAG: FHA domain-containing protein [Gammaproteobacteria bacterium]|nr:FHA domain-containing protein [Gammaproteobacteria bacterium]
MLARLVIIIATFLYLGVALGSPKQNDIILSLETLDSLAAKRTLSIQNTIADLVEGLSDGSQLGLIAFNYKAHLLHPLTEIPADNQPKLAATVDKLPQRGSLIDTASVLEQAIYELRTNGRPGAESPASNTISPESNAAVWFRKQPVSEIMTHPLFAISITSLMLIALISVLMLRRKQGNKAETNHSNTTPDASHAVLRDSSRFTGMTDYDITGKRTLIGRLPREITTNSCSIVINHPSIGRNHATIKYRNNGYWVYDSGTVNGTYINGERLHDTIQLQNGDKIRFGRFEFDAKLPCAMDLENGSKNGYTPTKTAPLSHTSTSEMPTEDERTVIRSRNH